MILRGPARVPEAERGDVAPTVILTALTVFLVMFVIQLGIFFHARTVLNAAAEDGTRAAQVEGATAADAEAVVDQLLAGSPSLLADPRRTVTVSGPTVTVAIEADVPSLVPFWSGSVTARSSGPVERFRPEDERRAG